MWLWLAVASPAASVAAGILSLWFLCQNGKHRDESGLISRLSIANSFILAAALYTMIVLVIGDMFLGHPIDETIRTGFGSNRIAWLLIGLGLDTGARLASLFD